MNCIWERQRKSISKGSVAARKVLISSLLIYRYWFWSKYLWDTSLSVLSIYGTLRWTLLSKNQVFYTNDLTISDTRILIYDAHIKCGKVDKTNKKHFFYQTCLSPLIKLLCFFFTFFIVYFHFSVAFLFFSCSFPSFVNFAKYHFYHRIRRQNSKLFNSLTSKFEVVFFVNVWHIFFSWSSREFGG